MLGCVLGRRLRAAGVSPYTDIASVAATNSSTFNQMWQSSLLGAMAEKYYNDEAENSPISLVMMPPPARLSHVTEQTHAEGLRHHALTRRPRGDLPHADAQAANGVPPASYQNRRQSLRNIFPAP